MITLGVGAVVILAVLRGLFKAGSREQPRERVLHIAVALVVLVGVIGWEMMWFTEKAIWSPAPHSCTVLATIELKGRLWRNCSYLVQRYEAGEWLFDGSMIIFALGIALDRLLKRRA
jgi:hypothetical protein